MAERRVSTRFAVEGESQYKAAIKSINSELKVLDSELKVANSSLKASGASIDALKAKQQALANVISQLEKKITASKAQTDKAKQAQAEWAAKASEAKQKLEQLSSSTDKAEKETDEYRQKIAQIQAEINRYEAAEQKAKSAVESHTVETNNARAKQNQYQSELDETEKALREVEEATNETSESLEEFSDGTDGAKEGIDALAQALAAAGVVAALKKIAESLKECVDASIEFESAMAGVAKTTNLSGSDLDAMGESFKEMSTEMPIAATELAQIAEIAGQLGVSVGNLESFTKVMAQLATATNMTSEEAATMIAQFAAITGMDLTNVDKLGSSIVALGNTFATNEKRITEMSQGIAGAATNAGMAETDMLALATAVTSLGIEAGMGGTNMSKLITSMQTAVQTGEGLETWAEAAGMTASEFAVLWGQDATGAILAFVQGLGQMGGEMNTVLDDLGIGEERFKRMVTSLANAESKSGMLTSALRTSKTAWDDNLALVKEAATRYETTESKIKMFENSVANLKTSIGDQLTPALGELAETGTDISKWADDVITKCPQLVSLVTALITAGGAFIVTLTGLSVAIPLVAKAWAALTATLAANPWMLAAAAIAAVAAAMATMALTCQQTQEEVSKAKTVLESIDESAADFDNLTSSLEEQAGTTDKLISKIDELAQKENKSAGEKALLSSMCDDLNSKVPNLAVAYDALTDSLNMTAEQMRAVAASMQEQAKQEAYISRLTELYREQAEIEIALADAQDELNDLRNEEIPLLDSSAHHERTLKVRELEEATGDLSAALVVNQESIDSLNGAYEESAESIQTYTQDEEGLIALLMDSSTKVQELVDKYKEMGEAAVAGAEQTAGGLLNVVEVVSVSSDKVIEALQSQTQFFNEYAENIKAAAENGLHEGLVAALSDGSMESAQILAGLAAEGWSSVDELNAAFADTEKGKESVETNVTEANAIAEEKLQGIVDECNDMVKAFNKSGEATSAGTETINGYVAGLNSNISGVTSAVTQINNAIGQIIRDVSVNVNVHTNYTESGKGKGGKATGLSYVPYDEFNINLHKGEMVLSALQAEAFRAQQRADRYGAAAPVSNSSVQSSSVRYGDVSVQVHMGGFVIREEADATKISEAIAEQTARNLRYRGSSLMGGRS